MSDDQFSQEDVAAILKRSAEIERERRVGTGSVGLSLDDLESIARESGLDPAAVRAAAKELTVQEDVAVHVTPSRRSPRGVTLEEQREIDGELDEDDLEDLVELAGRHYRLRGRTTEKRGSVQWAAQRGSRKLWVRANSRDGKTSLQLREDLRNLALKSHIGITAAVTALGSGAALLLGLVAESTIAHGLLVGTAGGVASLVFGAALAHTWFVLHRKRRDRELLDCADTLERSARQLGRHDECDSDEEEELRERAEVERPRRTERKQDRDEDRRRRRGRSRRRD